MNKHDIPRCLAKAATAKMLWAHSPVNGTQWEHYNKEALAADYELIGLRAANNQQIVAKLAMLQDWLSETLTPSSGALLQSVIADLEDEPGPTIAAPAPNSPAPQASEKAAEQPTADPKPATGRPCRDPAYCAADLKPERVVKRRPSDGIAHKARVEAVRQVQRTGPQIFAWRDGGSLCETYENVMQSHSCVIAEA